MTVLITGGDSDLARALAAALVPDQPERLVDQAYSQPGPAGVSQVSGDLRNAPEVEAALEGVSAVIHVAPYLVGRERAQDAMTALDETTRGSFVLFNAARAAGVERFILLSTLDL